MRGGGGEGRGGEGRGEERRGEERRGEEERERERKRERKEGERKERDRKERDRKEGEGREGKGREERKKEERADRNTSPSTIARTGPFCHSRAWKPFTPTKQKTWDIHFSVQCERKDSRTQGKPLSLLPWGSQDSVREKKNQTDHHERHPQGFVNNCDVWMEGVQESDAKKRGRQRARQQAAHEWRQGIDESDRQISSLIRGYAGKVDRRTGKAELKARPGHARDFWLASTVTAGLEAEGHGLGAPYTHVAAAFVEARTAEAEGALKQVLTTFMAHVAERQETVIECFGAFRVKKADSAEEPPAAQRRAKVTMTFNALG